VTKPSGKRSRPFRSLVDRLIWQFVLPSRRAVAVLLTGAAIISAGYAWGGGMIWFWLYNGLFAAVSIVDLATLPKRRNLAVRRVLPDRAEHKQPFDVRIDVSFSQAPRFPVSVEVADDLPLTFREHAPLKGRFEGRDLRLSYTTSASERGDFPLRYIYVRYGGIIGLWHKQARVDAEQVVSVYPDLSNVRGVMASMQDSLVLDGRKLHRKTVSGMELHAIREYSPDDDPRTINWAATARAGRMMTTIRQPEKGKIVTLMIDCGRIMTVELDGRTVLDRSLEAALTLAAVALRQGDQVATIAFSGSLKAYVPPGGGMAHLQTILEALYNLKGDSAETNYARAFDHLLRVQRKRSLIVLFSDMENYLFEEELAPYLLKLRRIHPVVLLSLQDPLLAGWAGSEIRTVQQAYVSSTAQSFELKRRRFAARMSGIGVPVLDVAADRLALAAVNHYLELKSRESI